MPALPLAPDDPREIGRYRLTGRLGEGGQGVVYLGEAPSGERVAVKVLKNADERARARFAREMAAARQVAAFATAAVLDSSAEGPLPYVVSEFVDGPSLQQRVADGGPLRGGDLQRLAVNTATALAAIHAAGIVHRDLKPANVLLGPDGPRVVDFGIARAIDAETRTQMVGTPAYFAPEWLRDHPPTVKSDVFAWAGTMVFAATGHPPFGRAATPQAAMHRIATAEPDLGGVPDALRPVLAACLAKDPDLRPTARDLAMRLIDPSSPPAPLSRRDVTQPQAFPGPPVPVPPPPGPHPGGGASGPSTNPLPPRDPTQPHPPLPDPPRPGPQEHRRRVRFIEAAVAAILVVTCVTAFVLLNRDGDSPSSDNGSSPGGHGTSSATSPQPATSSPSGTSPASSGGSLPAAFGGTWEGTLTQTGGITIGDVSTKVTVHLTGGSDGGTADYDRWGCQTRLTVSDVSGSKVDFDETAIRSTGSEGFCTGGPVSLKQVSGGLEYTSTGIGTTSGTLHKTG
ncbi:serine/threonine-protein kinase [Actinomadura opuntiae]|uniref:serine/threonine-protein kinase n=1 Tax=Actinomadura sp. OS1-43 TaxID=604315 RepID=UPI00255AACCC|nr:protein kinase [Actinomadura sp. OS1-43]MDL4821358.1 protein kinase [Actinomadura sp. OS1-43]